MFIEFALLGVLTGIFAGFFGMGGGTFLIPILVMLGLDIKTAIGISVMQMMFTSIFGSYINFRKQALDVNEGIIVGLGGFVGALFSGYVVSSLSSDTLETMFLVLIIFAIYRFFVSKPQAASEDTHASKPLLFGLGAGTGVFAISLGVGGALIMNPVLVSYLNYSIKKAVSLSLFYVIFSSVSGFVSMAYHGLIHYQAGLIVGSFSLIGVYAGVQMAHRTDPKRHKYMIIVLYFCVLGILLERFL